MRNKNIWPIMSETGILLAASNFSGILWTYLILLTILTSLLLLLKQFFKIEYREYSQNLSKLTNFIVEVEKWEEKQQSKNLIQKLKKLYKGKDLLAFQKQKQEPFTYELKKWKRALEQESILLHQILPLKLYSVSKLNTCFSSGQNLNFLKKNLEKISKQIAFNFIQKLTFRHLFFSYYIIVKLKKVNKIFRELHTISLPSGEKVSIDKLNEEQKKFLEVIANSLKAEKCNIIQLSLAIEKIEFQMQKHMKITTSDIKDESGQKLRDNQCKVYKSDEEENVNAREIINDEKKSNSYEVFTFDKGKFRERLDFLIRKGL